MERKYKMITAKLNQYISVYIITILLVSTISFAAEIHQKLVLDNPDFSAAGIKVRIEQINSGRNHTVFTDSSGNYQFSDVHVAIDNNSTTNINFQIGKTYVTNNSGSAQNIFVSVSANTNLDGKYASIIDLNGKTINKTLISQTHNQSIATTYWNGKTNNGISAPNSIYFANFPNGISTKLIHTRQGRFTPMISVIPPVVLKEFSNNPDTKHIDNANQQSPTLSKSSEDFPDNIYLRKISAIGIESIIDTLILNSQQANHLDPDTLTTHKWKKITGTIYDFEILKGYSREELKGMVGTDIGTMSNIVIKLLDDQSIIDLESPFGLIKRTNLSNLNLRRT